MIVRLKIDDPRWLDFVSANEGATPFHHPAWAALLGETYRYPAFAFAVEDGAGRIAGGLPILDVSNRLTGKRWVCLPYTDTCRPLVGRGGSTDEQVTRLDEERMRQGISKIEVRAELPGVRALRRSEAVVHTLALRANPEEMKRQFKPSVRRAIAKGSRAGVTVRRAEEICDLVETFYRLHVGTRRRQGVPVQPQHYFRRLWHRILKPGLGFCLLAYRDHQPLAGAVFLAWKDTVVYKYAASDHRYLSLRPNHVLLWEAIRWSGANSYSALDLGRTDLDQIGLRRFKSSWGAREEALIYSTLGDDGAFERSARKSQLLRPLIRRAPPSICRWIGELLYRYAA
jgi:CelD/BcsL family acetyltransferase involved in cellulose biosynthesis